MEPKVKFFAWTAMHEKILTTDNLATREMQHNPICPLCRNQPETAQHLLSVCSFTKEVLQMTWSWYFFFAGSPPHGPHVDGVASWLTANAAESQRATTMNSGGHPTLFLVEYMEGAE
jgi:hypothetical protein